MWRASQKIYIFSVGIAHTRVMQKIHILGISNKTPLSVFATAYSVLLYLIIRNIVKCAYKWFNVKMTGFFSVEPVAGVAGAV